jgi:hypothetical protein
MIAPQQCASQQVPVFPSPHVASFHRALVPNQGSDGRLCHCCEGTRLCSCAPGAGGARRLPPPLVRSPRRLLQPKAPKPHRALRDCHHQLRRHGLRRLQRLGQLPRRKHRPRLRAAHDGAAQHVHPDSHRRRRPPAPRQTTAHARDPLRHHRRQAVRRHEAHPRRHGQRRCASES